MNNFGLKKNVLLFTVGQYTVAFLEFKLGTLTFQMQQSTIIYNCEKIKKTLYI